MILFAIETSSSEASLALWNTVEKQLIGERSFATDRAHNSVIFGHAEDLLDSSPDRPDRIVVGLGPGSYSGIRVGIAVAQGFSLAWGIPAQGYSSLPNFSERDHFYVAGDARRKTFFLAEVNDGRLAEEPTLIPVDEFSSRLDEREVQSSQIWTPDKSVQTVCESIRLGHPKARRLASLASEVEGTADLEPHYLRAPYITQPGVPAKV